MPMQLALLNTHPLLDWALASPHAAPPIASIKNVASLARCLRFIGSPK